MTERQTHDIAKHVIRGWLKRANELEQEVAQLRRAAAKYQADIDRREPSDMQEDS